MSALPTIQNPSLNLIDNINLDAVKATVDKVRRLQATLKSILTEKHDFGKIPGCGDKPTLLKPGAEKILKALGLTSSYELIEHTENFNDKGFFAYTVRCTLSNNGAKITEGLGHANSKEKKWAIESVYEKDLPEGVDKDLLQKKTFTGKNGTFTKYQVEADANSKANTILKMAKKRAQIDAVLTVASLSEIFTQDFDDLPLEDEPDTKKDVEKVKEKIDKPKEEGSYVCEECTKGIKDAVYKFSKEKFGKALCYDCQQPYKTQKQESSDEDIELPF